MGKPNILLVDTTSFTLDLQKRILRGRFPKVEIYTASSGKQAQQTLQKYTMDIVLCELELPEMGGEELVAWMRTNDETKRVPFIVTTSHEDKKLITNAIKSGATDYLIKPFNPDKLLQKVVSALEKMGYQDNFKAQQDAVSLLTGSAKPTPKPAPSAAPVVAAATFARPAAPTTEAEPAPKQKMVAQLKLTGQTITCIVKAAKQNEVHLGARREPLPLLFEHVTLILTHPNIATPIELAGYVHLLQVASHDPAADFINIAIRFLNNDADKIALFEQFIAELHTK